MFKLSFYSTCKHAKALKHHLHVFTLSADSEVKLRNYKDLGMVYFKIFSTNQLRVALHFVVFSAIRHDFPTLLIAQC